MQRHSYIYTLNIPISTDKCTGINGHKDKLPRIYPTMRKFVRREDGNKN